MAISSTEKARHAARVRWDRFHADRIESKIEALVDQAPPLTHRQRVRLAKIIGITPADIPVRDHADVA